MELKTPKINKDQAIAVLFIILIFIVFLLDASTTKVNLCKINGNNTSQNCITLPIKTFPFLKE